ARERDRRRVRARAVAGVDGGAVFGRHVVRIEDVLHPDRHAVERRARITRGRPIAREMCPGLDDGLALGDAAAAARDQRLGGELATLDESGGLPCAQSKSVAHRLSIIAASRWLVETS